MHKILIPLAACLLTSCKDEPKSAVTPDSNTLAWRQCSFELDKIEAARGRNLDDLNGRIAVARNQFLMDCMGSKDATVSPAMLDELADYAKPGTRPINETNLNSDRKRL